jgi:hypothetical protein
MTQINVRNWRVFNTLIFGVAAITPWLRLELDAYSTPLPSTPGWLFVLGVWSGIWNDLIATGFNLAMLPFWLLGLSQVLVLVYIILNIYLLIKGIRSSRIKNLSFVLVGIFGVFLFPVLVGARPMWGYWLINLALLSSAILEWQKTDT